MAFPRRFADPPTSQTLTGWRPWCVETWASTCDRVVLISCIAAVVVGSAPAFLRPFINDESSYALVAHKLRAGFVMYRDAVDNKPPLIYWTFEFLFWVMGRVSMTAVKCLTIVVNAFSILLVAAIGRELFDRVVGRWAAFLFAASLILGVAQDSIATNTETYMNLFTLLGIWLWVGRDAVRWSQGIAGAAFAVAVLYRMQAAFVVVAAVVARLVSARFSWRSTGEVLRFGLGFLLPVLGVLAVLHHEGSLADFLHWTIRDNFFYIGRAAARVSLAQQLGRVGGTLASQLPLLLAALFAVTAAREIDPSERTSVGFVLACLGAALVGYQLGGRFYGHYFLQVTPFVSLAAAWGLARTPLVRLRWLLRLIAPLAIVWVVGFAVINVTILLPPEDDHGDVNRAAEFIRHTTRSDDQILLWNGSPLVALASDRPFATRFLNNTAMTGRIWGTTLMRPEATPEATRPFERPDAWRLFWQDLETAPPAFILDGGRPHFSIAAYPRLASFVAEHYRGPQKFGALLLYRRASAGPDENARTP